MDFIILFSVYVLKLNIKDYFLSKFLLDIFDNN